MSLNSRLQNLLPKLVLSPSVALIFVFVYGFIFFTLYLSFTSSSLLPVYDWVGLDNYSRLFQLRAWDIALNNLLVFGSLYIIFCLILGLGLALLIDQQIRGEGFIRPLFLYPMALSFIVVGTAWKWILDPGIGIEQSMHAFGWESFSFDWIKNRDMAIYTVVITAVWHTSGFIMAMFLAGLRGLDDNVLNAARIDGASGFKLFYRIILPQLRPVFFSAVIILLHMAIKAYDLIIALTGGGPGRATEVPATFMYSYTFTRNQMGVGASSAVIMLMIIAAIIVPYIYSELREKPQ